MKLIHLGYYKADYPSLGLAEVEPAAEVNIDDRGRAAALMVEGVFGPADPESKKVLIDALTEVEVARLAAEAAAEQAAIEQAAALEAEAARVEQEQQERRAAAQAIIDAAVEAAAKAALKAGAGKAGE